MKECKNCKKNDCCFLAIICIPYDYKFYEGISYEDFKKKHPDLNWQEAEEVCPEDLEAASAVYDRLVSVSKSDDKK